MERQKTQAVFLVDTCSPPAENLSRYCRSLCLVCTRILLFLSQFPNKEHQGRVQWNYKFFNSRKPEISVRTQTAQFYENRSELLQKFFGQLQSSLEHTHNQSSSLSLSWPQPPVKLVYSALAAAVQDFTWDAPEITSPIRRPSALSKRAKRGRKSDVKDNRTTKNVIFICSMCPQSKDELCHFLYGSQKQSDDSMVMLRSELLPPALLLQLEERGITVHWVDTQCACGKVLKIQTNGSLLICVQTSPLTQLVHWKIRPITSQMDLDQFKIHWTYVTTGEGLADIRYTHIFFQWFLSWLLHKWRESFLLPIWNQNLFLMFDWMLQLSSGRKWWKYERTPCTIQYVIGGQRSVKIALASNDMHP